MIKGNDRSDKRVLLIDSDEFNIHVTDLFLYACGFTQIVIARNSKEASEQFVKNFDLVLLNVHLSDGSGLDVCKQLRQMPRGKHIPILALAPKGKGIRTKCFKVGINHVMSSPTSLQGFKEAIQQVVN